MATARSCECVLWRGVAAYTLFFSFDSFALSILSRMIGILVSGFVDSLAVDRRGVTCLLLQLAAGIVALTGSSPLWRTIAGSELVVRLCEEGRAYGI